MSMGWKPEGKESLKGRGGLGWLVRAVLGPVLPKDSGLLPPLPFQAMHHFILPLISPLSIHLSGVHISLGEALKDLGCWLLYCVAGFSCHFTKEQQIECHTFSEPHMCHLWCRQEKNSELEHSWTTCVLSKLPESSSTGKREPGDRSHLGTAKSELCVGRSQEKQTFLDFQKFRKKDSFSLHEN